MTDETADDQWQVAVALGDLKSGEPARPGQNSRGKRTRVAA
jgi:hypothetical protein